MSGPVPVRSRFGAAAATARSGSASVYGEPLVNAHCPEFEVNKWALSEFVVRRLLPVVGIHPFPLDELLLMSAAVCRLRPRHIFEWGTNVGKSARIFYETLKWFGLCATVHSIDLPEHVSHAEHPGQQRGRLVLGLESVRLYQGDGLDTALSLGRELAHQPPFLFFLDGDHSESSVTRELRGVAGAFPEAAMLVHDTFYQAPESDYCTDPHAAVGKFLAQGSRPYATVTAATGLPGMTLLFLK
ncbi:MAG: hypothetical protein ABIL58_28995 [Pseudomonadota bacterium]